MKKEREENIWRRKILFCGGNEKFGKEREGYIWSGKIFFW